MARHLAAGIDIGTFETKVIIAEADDSLGARIIGTGRSESRGLTRGFVSDPVEAALSVREAILEAEKMAGLKLKRAYVSFGGVGLGCLTSTGTTMISRADLEISDRDMTLALEAAEAAIPAAALLNKKVINSIPLEYKMDGKMVWGKVEGLRAAALEVRALFITCLEHHLQDLIKTVEEAGVEITDIVAAPVASSFVTLSKKEKKVGCLLADLGAETLSIVVFENNNLTSLEVFPIGGADITNNIALGLKIGLEEAEGVKLGRFSKAAFSRKRIDEIISARLSECFELIERHLERIGRDALLPAGAFLVGGGSAIKGIETLAERALKLPARVAEIHFGEGGKNKIRENVWAVACGLAQVGLKTDDTETFVGNRGANLIKESGRRWLRRVGHWFAQFLP